MSFLTETAVPGAAPAAAPAGPSPAPYQPKGSFLNSVKTPTAGESARVSRANEAATAAEAGKANSDYQSSFMGEASNFVKGLWPASGIPEQFQAGVEQGKEGLSQMGTDPLRGALNIGGGAVNAGFSLFAPILGPVSKAINAVGNAPAIVDNPAIQKFAMSPAGQKTSDVAEEVANASNIALAILGGVEGVRSAVKRMSAAPKPAEAPVAAGPQVKGGFLDSVKAPVREPKAITPVKTVAERHTEYARSQGYEPYTPHEQLPTIQMGPKAENGLPAIQTEAPTPRTVPGDLTYEPIRDQVKPQVTPTEAQVKPGGQAEGKLPTPIEGSGDYHAAGSAVKVTADMVKAGVIDEVKDLPGFNAGNWDEQFKYTETAVNNIYDKLGKEGILDVLNQKTPLPDGLLARAFVQGAKDLAKVLKDGAFAKEVARSDLHSSISRFAQETGYGGYLAKRTDGEIDPVEAIHELDKALTKAAGKATTRARARATVEQGRTAIRPKLTMDKLEEFIKSIPDC